ncbi:PepSY domain-containing protein [uncultured Shewanella sp.]|uniref:PepSY-associated TM helix domain-containing protein n=1 Tax=uncultured Shewanella sp. TaxID=173975 RepID=UPI002624B299|nr:PepSY-associated TM helix domain-containing protein [uncultured Shewanella sp.]
MKPDFRRTMIWLHTYTGLIIGWLLFAIFLTGTLSYFNDEISQWMQPEFHVSMERQFDAINDSEGVGSEEKDSEEINSEGIDKQEITSEEIDGEAKRLALINLSIAKLKAQGKEQDNWHITLPNVRSNQWLLQWQQGKTRQSSYLQGDNGEQVNPRQTHGGDFFRTFHYSLELRNVGGRYFSGVAAMFMLLAVFSGIFTHRRFFRDFFTLRKKTLLKTLTDFHALAGIITIPFAVMICASALVIYIGLYMPWSAQYYLEGGARELNQKVTTYLPKVTPAQDYQAPISDFTLIQKQLEKAWGGDHQIKRISFEHPFDINGRIIVERNKQLSLSNKADVLVFSSHNGQPLAGMFDERTARKIRRIFYGLHEAHFADPGLRWLLFISGLLSCGLIASGLIIWLNKRLEKTKQRHMGHFIVERLNIAGIAGLVLAILAYFYANRLLPLDIDDRASVEVSIFLWVWLLSLLHSVFRPAHKAWTLQLLVAATACVLLPILDVIQQPQRLMQAIEQKNGVYLGFELVLLITGILLYKTATALYKRQKKPVQGQAIFSNKRPSNKRLSEKRLAKRRNKPNAA